MSEDTAPVAEEPTPNPEIVALQQQAKTLSAERDRALAEKDEVVLKANAIARERDDFRARLDAANADRDRFAGEKSALAGEVADLTRKADAAAAEIARLRHIVDSAPQPDPVELLTKIAAEKIKLAIAWVRAKIPADSPALPWFDKTVEAITTLGCVALKAADAFLRWAIPQAIKLTQRLLKEAEALLAKK